MLPSPRQTARMMRRRIVFAVHAGDSLLSSLPLPDTLKAQVARTHVLKASKRSVPPYVVQFRWYQPPLLALHLDWVRAQGRGRADILWDLGLNAI